MDKTNINRELVSRGYTLLQGAGIANSSWSRVLQKITEDLAEFQQSWQSLPPDNFLSDGGHYRNRRYSVFNWSKDGELVLLPHEAHYQSTYRNNMNGGVYREFEPFEQSIINGSVLKNIINFVAQKISFSDEEKWRIQAHQFRIETNSDEAGRPTPEGVHRDGADFILIMLISRENISGGVNHIYDDAKRLQFGGVLEECGDAVLLDDRIVWHGVSEVYPVDKNKPGYRDVLVLTFHNETFS